jgi:hypothetical protein
VVEIVENPTVGHEYLNDPDYYRLGYQLAAQLVNSMHDSAQQKRPVLISARDILFGETGHRDKDSRSRTPRADAQQVAKPLLEEARSMRKWYKRREEAHWWQFSERLAPKEKRLREFLLRTVEPCLKLVIAASLREESPSEAEQIVSPLRGDAKSESLSYRALYNLACYEAGRDDQKGRNRALVYLQLGIRQAPADRQLELVRWAKKDPSLGMLREREPDRYDAIVNGISPKRDELEQGP